MKRWCPLYIFSCPCPSNILNPPLHLQAVVGVGCCRAAASVRDKDESKINFISDISANKTPRQAFICIFSTVVVCLSYSGIRAVTFFSHSAFPSLSPASWFPQSAVFYVCFSLESGSWQGREEQRRASETWENEMRWLFILPAKATYLFRVALERGLKQHQRPCTQITCLATEPERLDGRMGGRKSGVPSIKNNSRQIQNYFERLWDECAKLASLFFFFFLPSFSHPFLTISGQGSSGGRTRLYNTESRARVSSSRGNGRWLW